MIPAFFSRKPITGHFMISALAITWVCRLPPMAHTTYSGSPRVVWLPQIRAAPSGMFSTPTAFQG